MESGNCSERLFSHTLLSPSVERGLRPTLEPSSDYSSQLELAPLFRMQCFLQSNLNLLFHFQSSPQNGVNANEEGSCLHVPTCLFLHLIFPFLCSSSLVVCKLLFTVVPTGAESMNHGIYHFSERQKHLAPEIAKLFLGLPPLN